MNSSDEDVTELVMKKDGSTLHIWAYVNGEQVFQASPEVTRSPGTIKAATETFLSRAWENEFTKLDDDDGILRGGFR